jgi:hypothetical protein
MAGLRSRGWLLLNWLLGQSPGLLLLGLQLIHSQTVSIFSFLASNSIAELLQAFSTNAELRSNCLLRMVVGEENERRQGCVGVTLFINSPHDVVEEWLEICRNYTLGDSRFLGSGKFFTIAGGPTWRLSVECARIWIQGSLVLRVCLLTIETRFSKLCTSNRGWALMGATLAGRQS